MSMHFLHSIVSRPGTGHASPGSPRPRGRFPAAAVSPLSSSARLVRDHHQLGGDGWGVLLKAVGEGARFGALFARTTVVRCRRRRPSGRARCGGVVARRRSRRGRRGRGLCGRGGEERRRGRGRSVSTRGRLKGGRPLELPTPGGFGRSINVFALERRNGLRGVPVRCWR